jgi:hypothetical protein
MSAEKPFVMGHARGVSGPPPIAHIGDPGALHRCMKRLSHAERLIAELLAAHDASEMSNFEAAIAKLRVFMEGV